MPKDNRAGEPASASETGSSSAVKGNDSTQPHEGYFRAIFDGAAIGITLVDAAGRPLRCNPALERFLGYSETELRALNFTQFTHPDDVEADLALYTRLIDGELDHYQLEKRYIRKDGKIVWARLTVSLIAAIPDRQRFVVAMVEDINSQKAAQAELVESEEKFLKAFHGNPNPSLLTRIADGRILEANQAFADWFCVTKSEAQSRTTFDFGIWPSLEERERLLTQLRKNGVIRNHELSLALPSGETRVVLLALQSLQLRGMECLLTITTDITPQKEAERALRRSEERLRLGLQAARMGAWEWDIATNSITWSPELHTLFGLPNGKFGGHFDAFLDLVLPEDRQRAELEVKRALEHPEFPYYTEFRTRWPDGSLHWIEARGEVRTDPKGSVFALLGTVVDITDRKELEASLRASQERELKAREGFSRHLLTTLEQERQSLAAELHDSIGQNLSLITNQAHLARAEAALPAGITDRLEAISRFTADAIAEVRNLVRNLRPIQIQQVGLTDSVRELIERAFSGSGIKVSARLENVDDVLTGPAATHVYRIIQEGINNIIKHASAASATIEIERDIRSVRLRVLDDGIGIDVASGRRKGGLGLTSISERAAMLGGVAHFNSKPQGGSRMLVEIPIPGLEVQLIEPSI